VYKKGAALDPLWHTGPTIKGASMALSRGPVDYEQWIAGLDDKDNLRQTHDVELVKATVRPEVEKEMRSKVDEMLAAELEIMTLEWDRQRALMGEKVKARKPPKVKGPKKPKAPPDPTKGKSVHAMLQNLVIMQVCPFPPQPSASD
jgi:hypothetical protein